MRWAGGLAAVASALLSVVAGAQAAVFEVRSCGTLATSVFTVANTSPGSIAASSQCPTIPNALLTGFSAVPIDGRATPDGRSATWTIAAPPGLAIQRLDVRRSIGTRREAWRVSVRTAEGAVLETCELAGRVLCQHGDPNGDTAAAYGPVNTRSIAFALECDTAPSGLVCPGRAVPQAWIAVYSAVALVDDPAPPALEPLAGTAVAPGWRKASAKLDVAARDASGIRTIRVTSGSTTLDHRQLGCDYTRMLPCPAGQRISVPVDPARLGDGTHELKVVVTDAADQPATATARVRVDRTAPAKPEQLVAERNADGTVALAWSNPGQGTAAPIAAARYEVCGATCTQGRVAGTGVARIDPLTLPAGEHRIRVWLEDEAGNVDPASAEELTFDPSQLSAPRAVEINPPVLLPSGPAPSPRLRITKARRSGSALTLSGTIARGATARITATAKSGRSTAKASTKPRRGKWSVRVRLTRALRTAGSMSVTVKYAGQASFRTATVRKRLVKRPGRSTTEFSIEGRR